MRIILLLFVAFALATSFRSTSHSSTKLKCILTCDRTEYKLGEVPQLRVKIINEGNEAVYLVNSLDGSDVKWRMPYCYFTIQKPKADSLDVIGRCGLMNPLTTADFVLVNPNDSFNPYQSSNDHGYFGDHETTRKENFRNPGIYKIRFHYNSNADGFDKFAGHFSSRFSQDSLQIDQLLSKTAKVELVSNEIEIRIIK